MEFYDIGPSFQIGNCDIHVNQKISFKYETIWDKISLKPKVKDQGNIC